MERKPARQQHDLDRHHRHGAPGDDAEQRQHEAGEHVGARGAAARADRLARPRHVRRIDGIADHLEREIGLHARAHVEGAVMKQRPAAVLALDAAQIDGDLRLELGIDRLGQIVSQQHVFGRDRGVGLQLEHPVAVRALQGQQRAGRRLDTALHGCRRRLTLRPTRAPSPLEIAARRPDPRHDCRTGSHLRSSPAGRSLVQSPARNKIAPSRRRSRTLGVLARRRREGGAALAHDLPRRQRLGKARYGRDLVPDLSRQRLARDIEQPVGGADGDRQPVRQAEQPFDGAVDDADDRREPGRRFDAEMRIDDGAELARGLEVRGSDRPPPPAAPRG